MTTTAQKNSKKHALDPFVQECFHQQSSGESPLDQVKWTKRSSKITNPDGSVVFEMHDIEAPEDWSQLAVDIVASKYFRKGGIQGDPSRGETSVRNVIRRIANTITYEGLARGYFNSNYQAEVFQGELMWLLVNQYGAFNSPVWFNCGLYQQYDIEGSGGNFAWDESTQSVVETKNAYEQPQLAACFIQSVKDDLMSIYDLVKNEARLFKHGSGTGSNFSAIRGKQEKLSGGGTSSGLMSFLEVFDRAAGATKSGGTTRRAAKMVCLDLDHPEIVDFIEWKMKEERKAQTLIAGGYASDFNGDAYHTVSGQNSNNSVRVTGEFMRALAEDGTWYTRMRTTNEVVDSFKARDLWDKIVDAAWHCADPGIQFDTTINNWHTCPNSGRIQASNPCCFIGETLVDTSEGMIPFADLEMMDRCGKALPYAYAFDAYTHLPVLKQIKRVWIAGTTKRLVEVTTHRGLKLRCTPEHRFLLRDGKYVEAQHLKPGMRLRKIGRTVNEARSNRRQLNHRATSKDPRGTVWENRFVWEQIHGPIPEGFHVHHKNNDPSDDRLSNLELIASNDHIAEHSQGHNNPMFIETDPKVLVEVWEAIESSINRKEIGRCATTQRMKALRADGLSHREIADCLNRSGILSPQGKPWSPSTVHFALKPLVRNRTEVSLARWNAYVAKHNLKGIVPLANNRGIQGKSWNEFGRWINEHRSDVNDSVLSVKVIDLENEVQVYDLEVDGVHNFGVTSPDAVSAGKVHSVIVHNSEYMFLQDTACNLASLNLTKFLMPLGGFDIDGFRHAVGIFFIAQEILVDFGSYPTREIAQNSHDYRPLGLGYANLGTLLMTLGVPYDSETGRVIAGAITSLMTGHAYYVSAAMAGLKGAFAGHRNNRGHMMNVIEMHDRKSSALLRHIASVENEEPQYATIAARFDLRRLIDDACIVWWHARNLGAQHGFRNAQATVLAPTGTIGLLMDCDTTGIEPDFALVKYKKLAGGGSLKIVNSAVRSALAGLGYDTVEVAAILAYVLGDKQKGIKAHDTIEGAPHLKPEHYAVFDCANRCGEHGTRFIQPMAHIKMMAAAQPFLSGAISKTVNLPNEATREDIAEIYLKAWEMGLKAVAVYRDGCKASQPLSSKKDTKNEPMTFTVGPVFGSKAEVLAATSHFAAAGFWSAGAAIAGAAAQNDGATQPLSPQRATRRRLPSRRRGFTQEARVGGHKLFLRTGEYEDGKLGEIFIDMHKEGAAFRSLMNCFAIAVSLGLQHGVSLEQFVEQFTFTRFEPQGPVEGHANVKFSTSIVDYIFRVLGVEYLKRYDLAQVPPTADAYASTHASAQTAPAPETPATPLSNPQTQSLSKMMGDAPLCDQCGHITVRNASCYRCLNCGASMGCS